MVRLNQNDARPTTQEEVVEAGEPPQLHHFSHVHLLQRLVLPQPSPFFPATSSSCGGCTLPCSGTAYACMTCNYVLHRSCALAPRTMQHPAHPIPGHTLALSITSANAAGRSSSCDACGNQCGSFSFNCTRGCEYNLHVRCARLVAGDVRHPSHPHPLSLTFQSPYGPFQQFWCDVCRQPSGAAKWLYRCDYCGFDVHLECADDTGLPQRRPQQEPQDPFLAMMERSHQESEAAMAELLWTQAELQSQQRQEIWQNLHPQNHQGSPFGLPFQQHVAGSGGPVNPSAVFPTTTETNIGNPVNPSAVFPTTTETNIGNPVNPSAVFPATTETNIGNPVNPSSVFPTTTETDIDEGAAIEELVMSHNLHTMATNIIRDIYEQDLQSSLKFMTSVKY